jgi:hypothetical protein
MTKTITPRETVAELFPNPGRFSHADTVRAAALITELIRYLNYATATSEGLPEPGTVYDVIGSLRSAFQMLDQAFDQLTDRFDAMAGHPNAEVRNIGADDERWPHRDVAGTAVALLALVIDTQIALASATARAGQAQVYAGRLVIVGPDEED